MKFAELDSEIGLKEVDFSHFRDGMSHEDQIAITIAAATNYDGVENERTVSLDLVTDFGNKVYLKGAKHNEDDDFYDHLGDGYDHRPIGVNNDGKIYFPAPTISPEKRLLYSQAKNEYETMKYIEDSDMAREWNVQVPTPLGYVKYSRKVPAGEDVGVFAYSVDESMPTERLGDSEISAKTKLFIAGRAIAAMHSQGVYDGYRHMGNFSADERWKYIGANRIKYGDIAEMPAIWVHDLSAATILDDSADQMQIVNHAVRDIATFFRGAIAEHVGRIDNIKNAGRNGGSGLGSDMYSGNVNWGSEMIIENMSIFYMGYFPGMDSEEAQQLSIASLNYLRSIIDESTDTSSSEKTFNPRFDRDGNLLTINIIDKLIQTEAA